MSFLIYDPESTLLFTRFGFWLFFGILLLGYSFVYKRVSFRNLYLLAFSLFFYYKTGGWFVLLLVFTTLINYFLGKQTGGAKEKRHRRYFLILTIIIDVGILAYCKYAVFFTGIINSVFHAQIEVVNVFGLITEAFTHTPVTLPGILLPVGISFYTFQLVSYAIEVYRKRIQPVSRLTDFAFYITFFPQVISGPIIKSTVFLPQMKETFSVAPGEYRQAIFLILSGLIKKIVIADYISLNFVTRVFENPELFTGFENLAAVYGYTLQIYCDFSGYTDIAIGIALLLGFRLPVNFNSPYRAANISDFWKRWHISLTDWFRSYMFLPLAYFLSDRWKQGKYLGMRTESWIYLICTMIVFLVCGLWHGARLNFVIWGGLHGAALVIHHLYKNGRKKRKSGEIARGITLFFTFQFIAFTWIIFRTPDLNGMVVMIRRIFLQFHPELVLPVIRAYYPVFLIIAAGFCIHWMPLDWKEKIRKAFVLSPAPVMFAIVLIAVLFMYQFRSAAIVPFIYFNF